MKRIKRKYSIFRQKLQSILTQHFHLLFGCFIVLCLTLSIFSTFGGSNSFALTIERSLPDKTQEDRANSLFKDIKCLICEGQAVHDSDSEFARSIRTVVRDQIAQGRSDKQVLAYVKEKYGSDILLKPPFAEDTVFIWLAPFFVITIGILVLVRWLKAHEKINVNFQQ
jgi:cytochrome c-type biogenesis protein CcmH/NrfF